MKRFKIFRSQALLMIFAFLLQLFIIHNSLIINPVFAQCPAGKQDTGLGCVATNSATSFTSDIYSIGLGLIGGVALISILIGAYLILTSQGDPVKLQNGKSYIVYAIIGLVLAIGGYAFYRIVGADILRIPGFQ